MEAVGYALHLPPHDVYQNPQRQAHTSPRTYPDPIPQENRKAEI